MGNNINMQGVRTKHVLVIDDDEATLFAYQALFKRYAFITLHACETLDCAMERMAARFFDVVITDLRLTGEGSQEGMEIIRCIRHLQPNAFALGASFYFEKPVHPSDMFDALRKLFIIDDHDHV
jgi:DNA-binding NtrC family response regulator